MIREIRIETNGQSKTLYLDHPESSGFIIEKVTGLGPIKANIITTNIANLDGALFNSARANYRNIVFSLYFMDIPAIEDARLESYKIFPLKQKIKIFVKTDNRECECDGYVEYNEPDIFSKREKTNISIICPDPYLYSIVEDELVFSETIYNFSFPFSNESTSQDLIIFGSYESQKRKALEYSGDFEVGINMHFHFLGAVGDITLYHIEANQSLKIDVGKIASLTGEAIKAGDDIYINTKNGEKGIQLLRNGEYINILNSLDKNPSWFQLIKGNNEIAFSALSGEENIQLEISYKSAYEGV